LLAAEESYRHAGVSRYIDNLLKNLACEDSEGDFTVFLNDRSALSLPCRQVHARFPTHNPWARVFWEQCALPAQLKARGIELLHSPVNIQPVSLTCKSIVTVTDLSFWVFPESFKTFQRIYQRLFTRLSARRATHLIAISAHTARDLGQFCAVSADRISVTYPGVDEVYRPAASSVLVEFRRQHELPEKFFLFVGTLEPRKNLVTLLKAFAAFRDSAKTGHKLVLAGGKGWLYQSVFAVVEQLGLQSDVIFAGFIPEAELPLWYNAADAFVYPSIYEGFGLPPLEAMACGTPVVVSNASSLPEVVGDVGILVDPRSVDGWTAALAQIVSDVTLRTGLSARGIERARQFSWARMARETIQVYRTVLAGGA
jgi:glycosyltransferase involved in cell wall biosynthesis